MTVRRPTIRWWRGYGVTNKSLGGSGGGVFHNVIGTAMLE
jgi:hypothetical protein